MRAGWKAIPSWRSSGAVVALVVLAALPALAPAAPAITPSGPQVPENLLRIELHLDRPLAAPLDMRRVRLFDGEGRPIEGAFLDLPLADQRAAEVSLLLHPGRIKTGVGPNLALGPALRAGQAIVLKIDDPQLGKPLEQRWLVGPPLRQAIDPQRWTVQPVQPGGRQPLLVRLPAALDGDAASLLALQGPDGRRVSGTGRLSAGEQEWRFTPAQAWRTGNYVLRIHPRLEDPQGNRLCSAFEQARQSAQACADEGRLPFIID